MKNTEFTPPPEKDVEKVSYWTDATTFEDFFETSRSLYHCLGDEQSKEIFEKRIAFNATGSFRTVAQLGTFRPRDDAPLFNFDVLTHEFQETDTVVIYGAGTIGSTLYQYLKEKKTKELLYCDRNSEKMNGKKEVPVISPDDLAKNYKNAKIVIGSTSFIDEIQDFLKKSGFAPEQILWGDYWNIESQYFDDVITLGENEVFVDCGVLDGGTSIEFAKRVGSHYKHIHLFEPEPEYATSSVANLQAEKQNNFTMHTVGVWDCEEVLTFYDSLMGGGFSVVDYGDQIREIKLPVNKLDNIFANVDQADLPTFIKMDIEGAELKALQGAAEVIRKAKPKLAICIYHKPQDLIEILSYIKHLVPEYQLYLRHYTITDYETVVYAIL